MTRSALGDLTGEVVLVTGSSRGIGKSIAQVLAAAGAKVVICSRKVEACKPVADEINAAGGTAIPIGCNVSDPQQAEAMVKETAAKLGPVSVLICNAATNPVYGSMTTLEDRAFDKIMATNVAGNIRLINLVIPGMTARGEGSIVLLSSVIGMLGSRTIGAYAISKAADIQVARNYAVELGPKNIRVNAIVPGLIKTSFSNVLWEGEGGRQVIARTPLGRLGEPEDIAGVALFLASKASRFVTGQSIVADGGVMISDPFLDETQRT